MMVIVLKQDVWRGMFFAYEAALWRNGPYSYVNRAWCRFVLFLVLPTLARKSWRHQTHATVFNSESRCSLQRTYLCAPTFTIAPANFSLACDTPFRVAGAPICFSAPVKQLADGMIDKNHRNLVLISHRSLKILEPLQVGNARSRDISCLTSCTQNRALDEFSPLLGELTVQSDRAKIEELMAQLRPFIKDVRIGYSGQRNAAGQHHGLGIFSSDQGHSYKGLWAHGKQHGSGCYYWTNGSCYSGEFMQNKRHGVGRMECARRFPCI